MPLVGSSAWEVEKALHRVKKSRLPSCSDLSEALRLNNHTGEYIGLQVQPIYSALSLHTQTSVCGHTKLLLICRSRQDHPWPLPQDARGAGKGPRLPCYGCQMPTGRIRRQGRHGRAHLIPVLGRQKPTDFYEFKPSLVYIPSSVPG